MKFSKEIKNKIATEVPIIRATQGEAYHAAVRKLWYWLKSHGDPRCLVRAGYPERLNDFCTLPANHRDHDHHYEDLDKLTEIKVTVQQI